jgi:hypothetical protein
MKPTKSKILVLGIIVLVLVGAVLLFRQTRSMSVKEVVEIARDAYIYGYPLVTFDMARRQQTNVAVPDAEHAPMGQIIKMRSYPAVDNHCCAAPNADTLYTLVWLDVSGEPWVFGIPEMGDRYYIMPMLDGFSEVFHVASASTTGGGAQTYAIAGPGWSGALPEGVTRVDSPTAMVWVLGRIYCLGTVEDYDAVHALQDQFTIMPLSAYGTSYTPPPGIVDPDFDMKTSVRDQVNSLDIYAYFNYLAHLLKSNPPKPQDAAMVKRMAKIGLVAGQDFVPSKLSSLDKKTIEAVPKTALEKMEMGKQQSTRPHFAQGVGSVQGQDFDTDKLGSLDKEVIKLAPKIALLKMALRLKHQKTTNGWLYFTEGVGNFGTDYVLRGMANLLGPGWNRPQDAVYPISQKDAEGNEYDGAKYKYVIRFDKGGLPPVDAFWSLTMYDKDLFFVPNPIDRYALSQRNTFITNPDGSVDFYIQAESPGKDKEANWLPAPQGKFNLVLRLYGPPKSPTTILDGSWTPPPVKRVP